MTTASTDTSPARRRTPWGALVSGGAGVTALGVLGLRDAAQALRLFLTA